MQRNMLTELQLPKLEFKNQKDLTKNSSPLCYLQQENNVKNSATKPVHCKAQPLSMVSDFAGTFPAPKKHVNEVNKQLVFTKRLQSVDSSFKKNNAVINYNRGTHQLPKSTSTLLRSPKAGETASKSKSKTANNIGKIKSFPNTNFSIKIFPIKKSNSSSNTKPRNVLLINKNPKKKVQIQLQSTDSSQSSPSSPLQSHPNAKVVRSPQKKISSSLRFEETEPDSGNTELDYNFTLDEESKPFCVISEVIGNADAAFSGALEESEENEKGVQTETISFGESILKNTKEKNFNSSFKNDSSGSGTAIKKFKIDEEKDGRDHCDVQINKSNATAETSAAEATSPNGEDDANSDEEGLEAEAASSLEGNSGEKSESSFSNSFLVRENLGNDFEVEESMEDESDSDMCCKNDFCEELNYLDATSESEPALITPKKTNDITKIKGWRRKQFLVEKPTTVEFYRIDKGPKQKKIKIKGMKDSSAEAKEPSLAENAFTCDSLDEFLNGDVDLKISYEIPHLYAELGIKLTSEDIFSKPNFSKKDCEEVENRYRVVVPTKKDVSLDDCEEECQKAVKRPAEEDKKTLKFLKTEKPLGKVLRKFTDTQKVDVNTCTISSESESKEKVLEECETPSETLNQTLAYSSFRLESKLLGLAVYPSPHHPVHPLVKMHLEKLRSYSTRIDKNWANFAASAVQVNTTQYERMILPALCCVKVKNDAVAGNTVADDNLADDTVADDTVADDTVADDTVADDNLADDTVADDNVADATAADNAAAGDAVADNTVANDTMVADAVANTALTGDTVVADNTVANDMVVVGTVTSDASADDTVANDMVVVGTVASDALADDTVANDMVVVGTVASDALASDMVIVDNTMTNDMMVVDDTMANDMVVDVTVPNVALANIMVVQETMPSVELANVIMVEEAVPNVELANVMVVDETVPNVALANVMVVEETVPSVELANVMVVEEAVPNVALANVMLVDESVANDALANLMLVDNAVANVAVANETVVDETVASHVLDDETVVDDTVANNAVADEPVAHETVIDEMMADDMQVGNTVACNTVTDDTAFNNEVADDAVANNEVIDNSVAENMIAPNQEERTEVAYDSFLEEQSEGKKTKIAEVVRNSEETPKLKECCVVINKINFVDTPSPWCMEHLTYDCKPCGLLKTNFQNAKGLTREQKRSTSEEIPSGSGENHEVSVLPKASFSVEIANLLSKKLRSLKYDRNPILNIDHLKTLVPDNIEFIKLNFIQESYHSAYIRIWYLKQTGPCMRSRAFLTFSESPPMPYAINLKPNTFSTKNLPKIISDIVSPKKIFSPNEYAILHCNGEVWEIHGSLNIVFGKSDKSIEQVFATLELPELNELKKSTGKILKVDAVKWWILDLTQEFRLIEIKFGNVTSVLSRKKLLEFVANDSLGFIPLRKLAKGRTVGAYINKTLFPFVLMGPYYLFETHNLTLRSETSVLPFMYFVKENVRKDAPLKYFINSVVKDVEENNKVLDGLWFYDKKCVDNTSYIEVMTRTLGTSVQRNFPNIDIEHGYSLSSLTNCLPPGVTAEVTRRKDGLEEFKRITVYLYFDIFELGYLEGELQRDNSIIISHPLDRNTKVKSHRMGDWFVKTIKRRIEFIPKDIEVKWFITKHVEDLRGRRPFNKFLLGGAHVLTKNGLFYLLEMSESKIQKLGLEKNEITKAITENQVIQLVLEMKNLANLLTQRSDELPTMQKLLKSATEHIKVLETLGESLRKEKMKLTVKKLNLTYTFLKILSSYPMVDRSKLNMVENIEHFFLQDNGDLDEEFMRLLRSSKIGRIYYKRNLKYYRFIKKVRNGNKGRGKS